jgi:hypothetical protein
MIPITGFIGDMESVALYAGESCNLIHDIKPAAQMFRTWYERLKRSSHRCSGNGKIKLAA